MRTIFFLFLWRKVHFSYTNTGPFTPQKAITVFTMALPMMMATVIITLLPVFVSAQCVPGCNPADCSCNPGQRYDGQCNCIACTVSSWSSIKCVHV